MKFFVSSIMIALLSFASCLYMPWWSVAIMAFLVNILIFQKPSLAFLSGFIALFVLWTIMTLYISSKNEDVLAHKMSLIILKTDSPFSLVLFTGIIGALVAGFAALAGSHLRKATRPAVQFKPGQASDGSKPSDA